MLHSRHWLNVAILGRPKAKAENLAPRAQTSRRHVAGLSKDVDAANKRLGDDLDPNGFLRLISVALTNGFLLLISLTLISSYKSIRRHVI